MSSMLGSTSAKVNYAFTSLTAYISFTILIALFGKHFYACYILFFVIHVITTMKRTLTIRRPTKRDPIKAVDMQYWLDAGTLED